MEGLVWDCRGPRNKGVFAYVRNLISQYKFSFIRLQETMIKDGLAKKSFKIFCGRPQLLVQAANVGLKITFL